MQSAPASAKGSSCLLAHFRAAHEDLAPCIDEAAANRVAGRRRIGPDARRHKENDHPTPEQHGEQDIRVPISQGYELHNALRRQNVPTKMVVYPRQPHGIQEPQLIKDAMERNLEWFDRWIKGRPGTQDQP